MISKILKPLAALPIACGLLLSAGCTASNESAAGIEGVDPSATGRGPAPKSQEDYMKQVQQSGGSTYKNQGYPGAR